MEKDIPAPICPVNLYFEGDEDKCNPDFCDWDTDLRMCSQACERGPRLYGPLDFSGVPD